MNKANVEPFRIRSYVGRNSRITATQRNACTNLFNDYGLPVTKVLDLDKTFGRNAPTYLEIGFGSGQSLLAAAKNMPDYNFIGVETHLPGVGSLINNIKSVNLNNLRVYQADVIDVLEKSIPDASLSGVQIFFPDPWPKRRHHERRLIQSEFLDLLLKKIRVQGSLHLATDWEDYAHHMLKTLTHCTAIRNIAGVGQYATRSPFRPIITKFEQRALREGRSIWELQFVKC